MVEREFIWERARDKVSGREWMYEREYERKIMCERVIVSEGVCVKERESVGR